MTWMQKSTKWKRRALTDLAAADAWRQLRQGGLTATGDEVPSLMTGVEADAGVIRFALGPSGEGRLLLPITQGERVPAIAGTPALKILDATWVVGSRSCRFLDLTCVVRDLDGVFAEVVGEIVRRVGEGHAAVTAAIAVIDEFRLLLMPQGEHVDVEVITGLIGELLLLDRLLNHSADALHLWRGPLGDRHDFRAGPLAIEVKTTGRAGNEIMHVGSIDQLLEPLDGELCLARYTLEQAQGGAVSVAALSARVAAKVGDPMKFRSQLAAINCVDPTSADWNAVQFELQEERFYRVDAAFPRIIPLSFADAALPAGTQALEYDVDLVAARASLLSVVDTNDYLARMIACLT